MIHSDAPIDSDRLDRLRRARFANALAATLGAPELQTPFTVGIFGGWGTGKTSLMRLLDAKLQARTAPDGVDVITLWFDAWAYAREEQSLWRALLLTLTGALGRDDGALADEQHRGELKDKLRQLETSLYRSLTLKTGEQRRLNWGAAMPFAADLALRFATAGLSDIAKDHKTGEGIVTRMTAALKGKEVQEMAKFIETTSQEAYVEEVRSLEQFRRAFADALGLVGIGAAGRRLYVFVDDLDRCLPEDAVAAVEAMKLFLDIPGCVFVLGMDHNVVQIGIGARFARTFEGQLPPLGARGYAEQYLDKIIQMPLHLPPLEPELVAEFLGHFQATDASGLTGDCKKIILLAAPPNPRALKRILNVLRFAAELVEAGANADRSAPNLVRRRECLAKLILLQLCFVDTYRCVLKDGEARLLRIERMANREEEPDSDTQVLFDASPELRAMLQEGGRFIQLEHTHRRSILALTSTLSVVTADR